MAMCTTEVGSGLQSFNASNAMLASSTSCDTKLRWADVTKAAAFALA